MLWLLLVGNPSLPFYINEIMVAPDSLEFAEMGSEFYQDMTGFKVITRSDTVQFKDGIVVDWGEIIVLDTSVLMGHLSLNDDMDTIKIVDPEGRDGYLFFNYSPSPSYGSCYSAVTPPGGLSAALFDSGDGFFAHYYYMDSTPTPGLPNDDRDGENRLYGLVLDQETGLPVSGATVYLHLQDHPCGYFYPQDLTDATDTAGYYEIVYGPGRTLGIITTTAAGYETETDTLELPYNFVQIEHSIYLYPVDVAEGRGEPRPFLRLFPNPTPGLLKLSWSKGPQDVLIYDVLGREMTALPGELGGAEINLPPGVYFISRGKETIRAVVKSDKSSVY